MCHKHGPFLKIYSIQLLSDASTSKFCFQSLVWRWRLLHRLALVSSSLIWGCSSVRAYSGSFGFSWVNSTYTYLSSCCLRKKLWRMLNNWFAIIFWWWKGQGGVGREVISLMSFWLWRPLLSKWGPPEPQTTQSLLSQNHLFALWHFWWFHPALFHWCFLFHWTSLCQSSFWHGLVFCSSLTLHVHSAVLPTPMMPQMSHCRDSHWWSPAHASLPNTRPYSILIIWHCLLDFLKIS